MLIVGLPQNDVMLSLSKHAWTAGLCLPAHPAKRGLLEFGLPASMNPFGAEELRPRVAARRGSRYQAA